MLPPPESDVTIVVIEMGPGWVVIKLIDPRPKPDRAESLLRRTIDHWVGDHPQFVIDQTEAFEEDGMLRGFHVRYPPQRSPGRARHSGPTAATDLAGDRSV